MAQTRRRRTKRKAAQREIDIDWLNAAAHNVNSVFQGWPGFEEINFRRGFSLPDDLEEMFIEAVEALVNHNQGDKKFGNQVGLLNNTTLQLIRRLCSNLRVQFSHDNIHWLCEGMALVSCHA